MPAGGHVRRRKRADGSTTYQAKIPDPTNPAAKQIVKSFMKLEAAERWLIRQAGAIENGTFIDPEADARRKAEAILFNELVAQWERTRVAKLAPRTRERYKSITRKYLLPEFGPTPAASIRRPDIKRYFAGLEASPATQRKIHTVLSSILSEGVELDVLRENPAVRLRLEAPPRPEMTVLTRAEIRALAEATERPADRLAVYVAAYTGLRAGELWALRRRDIDLEHRRIIVRRTLTSESGELVFRNEMKTAASRRVVSLPRRLMNMLAAHLESVPHDPDALVFTAPGGANGRRAGEGGPIRHEQFRRRVFKPAVKAAIKAGSLPASKAKLRWHDLRHTCASILISEGVGVKIVQTRLGHSSAATTWDRYSWIFPSEEEAAADALDAVFEDAFEDSSNVVTLKPSSSTAASDAATG